MRARAALVEIVGAGFDVGKFVENFEVLAEAEGGVARIRGFVLDLATRGQLVPQLARDGSGEALLATIAPRVPKASVRLDEGPFAIPVTWSWTTIGSVCSYIQRGKSPTYVESSEVPVVSQKCVQWEGFLIERARFVDPTSLSAYAEERLLRQGDLLWNSTGHGTVGRIAVFRPDARYPRVVADSHVTVVRPEIDPGYLWCWIASPTVQSTIDDLVSGTTKQTELATSTVVAQPLPLPPLAEQKRIVAKVDQLMALCDELEARQTTKRETGARLTKSALEALTSAEGPEEFERAWTRVVENFEIVVDRAEKVGELRRALLQLAVSGALSSSGPSAWKRAVIAGVADCRLGKMLDKVKNRGTPRPYLRNTNVHWFRLELDDIKEMLFQDAECDEYELRAGDLVVCEGGHGIGRTAVWTGEIKPMMFQKALHRIRPRPEMNSMFLAYQLKVAADTGSMSAYFTGAGIPHLTGRRLAEMEVVIPPVSEQHAVVAKVEQLMKVCDDLEAKLRRAEDRAARLVEAVVREMVA